MPGNAVYQVPPQLPPLPAQPSLASPSSWKLHYPPEDVLFPPSSWATSTPPHRLRRSNSTSPPRPLPDPLDYVAGDSTGRPRAGTGSSTSSSRSRTHSHSRSNSRVPIPVLPSASSSELVMVPPPIRTHSKSKSVGLVKLTRPLAADGEKEMPHYPHALPFPVASDREKSALRPLPIVPRVPKPPPPPLPLPDRAPVRDHSISALTQPAMHVASPAPATLPHTSNPSSAPPRAQLRRMNSTPHMRRAPEPVPVPLPITSPVPSTPQSAPVRRKESLQVRERARSNGAHRERPVLIVLNPDEPFLNMHIPEHIPESAPVRAPIRAPTPPKPRSATHTLPSTPTNRGNRIQQTPSSWRPPQSSTGRVVAAPTPVRGRTMEVSLAIRTSPTVAEPDSPPRKPEGVARKWVLEKKGKRLTQDSLVVAQQLRMLR